MTTTSAQTTYVDLLPSIYQSDPLLAGLLRAFEHVFSGLPDGTGEPKEGLEDLIASIVAIFQPKTTRDEFLPWLSEWVALGLRADWTTQQQRDFLQNIVGLYRRRGTKDNLVQLLQIYTGLYPTIADVGDPQGEDIKPHHFHVNIHMAPDRARLQSTHDIAEALINLQKPAHTTYSLSFSVLTMQIRDTDQNLQLGVNTLLGSLTS
jgi:phage tail-like protein